MPTCNAVLEEFATQNGFGLASSMADNRTWTECLEASHGACANNGTKRPEAGKDKRPLFTQGQAPRPKKHKKSAGNPDVWNWGGYDHPNDWNWSGYDHSNQW
jgi:hypothetical protein